MQKLSRKGRSNRKKSFTHIPTSSSNDEIFGKRISLWFSILSSMKVTLRIRGIMSLPFLSFGKSDKGAKNKILEELS